jgi:predicted RND superfamily exporter protein
VKRVLEFPIAHWRAVLATALVVTLMALLQLVDLKTGNLRIEIDPSVDRLLSQTDEQVRYHTRVSRLFGSDENFVIVIAADNLFSSDVIRQIDSVTVRLEALPHVWRVVSLSNAPLPEAGGDDISVASAVAVSAQEGEQGLAKIKNTLLTHPLYRGTLVSEDGGASAIVITLNEAVDLSARQELNAAIERVLDEEHPTFDAWITGLPRISVGLTELLLRDILHTSPLIVVVLIVVLAASFRNVYAVIIPLVSVAIPTLWTLALITLLGYSLNIVTVLVPPLLLVLGLSYSLHVVSEYQMLLVEKPAESNPVARALAQIALPTILAGLTTVVGFLSLMLSPLGAIREFGLFTVIGTILSSLSALIITPALLAAVGRKPVNVKQTAATREPLFDKAVSYVALFDYNARIPIFIGAAAIMAISIGGATQIQLGMDFIGNLPSDSETRIAADKAEELLGGTNTLYVVVEAGYKDAWRDPANLEQLKTIQQWLEQQPEVNSTRSIVDYISALSQVFRGETSENRQLPSSRDQISQMLFLCGADDTKQFIDPDFQLANIVVRLPILGSDVTLDLVARINQYLSTLPRSYQGTVTGYPVLVGAVLDKIIAGQVQSVLFALVLIYALLSTLFLSLRIGFIALIPNIIPVAAYFGGLGLFGIPLSPATSIVAPMVLGLAIDDTIHYFTRFNSEIKRTANQERATVAALRHVGRPVTFSTLGLCLGFLALTMAEVQMQVEVGIMASFALAVAWLADFILSPALCARTRFVTLWDALSLDLGNKPQDSMRLFKGLSTFQARIFARLASIIEVPAGTRIIHYGDSGAEMYAIIDGTVEASIAGGAGRVVLGTYVRGDLFGEAGLYFDRRTADVDVTEDARLLRVSRRSLERLRDRYPRISAKVMKNLNEVLAQRLASTTDKLGES